MCLHVVYFIDAFYEYFMLLLPITPFSLEPFTLQNMSWGFNPIKNEQKKHRKTQKGREREEKHTMFEPNMLCRYATEEEKNTHALHVSRTSVSSSLSLDCRIRRFTSIHSQPRKLSGLQLEMFLLPQAVTQCWLSSCFICNCQRTWLFSNVAGKVD